MLKLPSCFQGVNEGRLKANKMAARNRNALIDLVGVPTENRPILDAHKAQVVALRGVHGTRTKKAFRCLPLPNHATAVMPLAMHLHAGRTGCTEFLVRQCFNSFGAPNFQFSSYDGAALTVLLYEHVANALEGKSDVVFCRQYVCPNSQPPLWNSVASMLRAAASWLSLNNPGDACRYIECVHWLQLGRRQFSTAAQCPAGVAERARDAMRFVQSQRGVLMHNGEWVHSVQLGEEEYVRLSEAFPPGDPLIVSLTPARQKV